MYKSDLAPNMRQKLITLDPVTWDLAIRKTNFSEWVRNQLRSERNKSENDDGAKANTARKLEQIMDMSCFELMSRLQYASEDDKNAVMTLIRKL